MQLWPLASCLFSDPIVRLESIGSLAESFSNAQRATSCGSLSLRGRVSGTVNIVQKLHTDLIAVFLVFSTHGRLVHLKWIPRARIFIPSTYNAIWCVPSFDELGIIRSGPMPLPPGWSSNLLISASASPGRPTTPLRALRFRCVRALLQQQLQLQELDPPAAIEIYLLGLCSGKRDVLPHSAITIHIMSHTQIPMFASATSIPSSAAMSGARRTLRERCGFTLFISFTPAFPKMIAKGHLEPTAGNLPRRKRSSVVCLEIPAPAPIVAGRAEYFA
ncbi:hypothetical protein DFH08DRAFT_959695 [Mycena albidolilacea]|uniref:Uncharacterized protein n=1 Tax=Mycena albidolilacea TaxID=1033008 RepID=A0AAD7ES87_9AGAR|nr:hypothetical protein DFH08DRAFT_959695 [Mycena albidolilacea]